MNNSNNTSFRVNEDDQDNNFKKEFFKYLFYWKYFLISATFFLIVAFTFLRYSPKVFNTTAKIQIIDKKESSFELPSAVDLFSNSKINLENEIEIIKSFPILENVVKTLNLQLTVNSIGDITKTFTIEYPFEISLNFSIDSLIGKEYILSKTDLGFEIIDLNNKSKTYSFKGVSTKNYNHSLPFEIFNFDKKKYAKLNDESYQIQFSSLNDIISSLKEQIQISQIGDDSDIIELIFNSNSPKHSEIVLNELINVFNNDGVKDRQLVHKRTIDFVNARYAYLSIELDSIEVAKQLYKVDNNLVDLSANSAISLEKSFSSEKDIFKIENQISITKLLLNTLTKEKKELLPANMVIENEEINNLISEYNQIILDRKKLFYSAGSNNPSTQQLEKTIIDFRSNIIYSLQSHLSQLQNIKSKLSNQFNQYNNDVSNLPEKEKILRAIERNQKIKESLYLFLLQKREEAEVSYAVTEPSIKIVENAISDYDPISPRSKVIYLLAIFLGFMLPFTVIYLLFYFNRKIFTKEQVEELKLPISIVGEIPEIDDQSNTLIKSARERSPLAESFRVLSSKLRFYTDKNKKDGQVTIVSSTIKGEGKTFCATNLALTKASLGEKVLLIGADLHNPQIHTYLNIEKNHAGLVNYLVDSNYDWKKAILKFEEVNCDILIGGQIPPNPAQLLNNGNFGKLLNQVKKVYDHIIIDTPPCLLVSDTLSMSPLADLLIFVVRCNHTDINILDFINDTYSKGIINKNSVIVLNGLGAKGKYGYGYAYNYSYGYRYNYSYNYNYGYGYEYKSED